MSTLTASQTETGVDAGTLQQLEQRRQRIVANFQTYFQKTYYELHAASYEQTKALEEGLRKIKLEEEDIAGWEDFWAGEAQNMMASAHRLYHDEFMDTMLRAYNETPRVLSLRAIKELDGKFKAEDKTYKQKESYVQNTLPKRIAEWRRVAQDRARLMKDPRLKRLSSDEVADIDVFLDEDRFLDLKYPDRVKLLAAVKAALSGDQKEMNGGMLKAYAKVKQELEGDTRGPASILHPSKVGIWLDRIFSHCKTASEVDDFMSGRFEHFFRKNWRKVRAQFNTVEERIGTQGIPYSFHQVNADTFLRWDFPKREAYIAEAMIRLDHTNGSSPLAQSIRRDLYMEDWEGAEEQLQAALAEHSDDLELQSLKKYLDAYRDDAPGESAEDPETIVQRVRESLEQTPEPLRKMHIKAAEEDTADPGSKKRGVLECELQMEYNLVWIKEHGFWDEEKGAMEAHSQELKGKTKHFMENGHTKMKEVNIVEGETEDEAAIREKCTSPQIIYMGESAGAIDAVHQKTKLRQDDQMFSYWTTLKAKNVSYAEHRQMVKTLNHTVKSGIRKLRKMGIPFKMYDEMAERKAA